MIQRQNHFLNEKSQNSQVRQPNGDHRQSHDAMFFGAPDGNGRSTETNAAEQAQPLRMVEPAILLGIGGKGNDIVSRTKRLLGEQGTDHFVEFIGIDTDETARAGVTNGCPFGDREFVALSTTRNGLVLDKPSGHRKLFDRLGLSNPSNLAHLQKLHNDGVEQAGQCRGYGALSLSANHGLVVDAVQHALSHINGVHNRFQRQLQSDGRVQIRRKTTVFIVFSVAGGTGSSMGLEVAAIVRQLTHEMNVRVVGVMVMPSVFQDLMKGKAEQQTRIFANAYGTVSEIDAIQLGFGTTHKLSFGPTEDDAVDLPAGIFNQMFVATRHLADGRDLLSDDAVTESVSLHLAAEIGTEIGDKIDSDDDNHATLRGQICDPDTAKPRGVSTIGAAALALPIRRLARSATARWLGQFLLSRVLGSIAKTEDSERLADTWLNQPLQGEALAINADDLPTQLQRCVAAPRSNELVRPLYQQSSGGRHIHWKNAFFVKKTRQVDEQFQQKKLPDMREKLSEVGLSLQSDLEKSLTRRVRSIVDERGWRAVGGFVQSTMSAMRETIDCLEEGIAANKRQVTSARELAQQSVMPLTSWWRAFGRNRKRQNAVVRHMSDMMLAAIDSQAKTTSVKLVKHLIERLENHGRVAERTVASADSRLRRVTEVFDDTRPGTSVTTDSLAEIDASTEKVDLDLYNRHQPEIAAVLQRLVKGIGKSTASVLRQVVIDDNQFQQLEQSLLNQFGQRYGQVCVVDVVAGQLADPQEREIAEAKMRQVVDSCQPMWGRAEPGRLGMRFSDTVIVGVPESENSANQSSVSSLLTEIASGRSNADTRYNGSTSQVTSGDKRRICVVRRVHGGCFHYLPELDKCRRAYDKWLADGGHSVHIIDDATVAKLPSLFPGKEVDDGQFAFAVGLCYGWVAARGPHWYWNLKEDDAKPGHFICRLTSDWNGAAFDNRKLAITTGALKSFTDTNRLVYEQRSDMLAADKLGQGMENAQQTVLANGEMIEMINDLFADMRAAVGDVSVARELETYLGSLKTRTRSSDQNYALITGMAKLLSQRVVELRNG